MPDLASASTQIYVLIIYHVFKVLPIYSCHFLLLVITYSSLLQNSSWVVLYAVCALTIHLSGRPQFRRSDMRIVNCQLLKCNLSKFVTLATVCGSSAQSCTHFSWICINLSILTPRGILGISIDTQSRRESSTPTQYTATRGQRVSVDWPLS